MVDYKTSMTTSLITEAQKSWMFNNLSDKISRNLSHVFKNIFVIIFCGRTDRPTDQVNYILYALWHRKSPQKISAIYLE